LESVRILKLENTRFYQASTSEIFGNSIDKMQNETTPFSPASPYAVAKLYAHHMVGIYRNSYDMHASCGILFNHESPIRGQEFVTRKITQSIIKIHRGEIDSFALGNINAKRDWGHARDYVRGMWMMMQTKTPDDYVLATGQSHSIRDFITRAFQHINIDIIFEGSGVDEVGLNAETKDILVTIDPQLYRPNDVNALCGDAEKARKKLGWLPEISLDNLIAEMINYDLKH
jgi:GDPmannose 4,6-dehydratase